MDELVAAAIVGMLVVSGMVLELVLLRYYWHRRCEDALVLAEEVFSRRIRTQEDWRKLRELLAPLPRGWIMKNELPRRADDAAWMHGDAW